MPGQDYKTIDAALVQMDAEFNAGTAHGVLCGLHCAKNTSDAEYCCHRLLPTLDINNLLHKTGKQLLLSLFTDTIRQLNDPHCDFELLLPSDDIGIEAQVVALGDWCQGFLLGLSMAGVKDLDSLPENSAEIATDLVQIARAGSSYYLEDSTEDEAALQDLIEYVRVGVLLMHEEMCPVISARLHKNNLH
jgi:uncharacterized protein YgfB (UPF0149 family)